MSAERLVSAAMKRWTGWWNPRIDPDRLDRAGQLAVLAATVDVIRKVRWLRQTQTPPALRSSFGPLRAIGIGRLGRPALDLLFASVVGLGVLTMAIPSRHRRVGFFGLGVTYAWWHAEHFSYGVVSHASTSLVVALLAFSIAPTHDSVGAEASGWPLQIASVHLAYLYLTATWAKVHLVGLGWWHRGATEAGIALWGPHWAQHLAGAHLAVVHAGALLAMVAEPCVAVGLLFARTRRPAAVVAVAFHLAVLLLMNIDFVPMAACVAIVGWSGASGRRVENSEDRSGAADPRNAINNSVRARMLSTPAHFTLVS